MKFKDAKQMLKSYAGMTHKLSDNQGRPKLDQAIDLMLKELEKEKEGRDILAKLNKEIFEELETYKKIAEKLAEEYWFADSYCPFESAEEVIDWARKEVENG